MASPLADDKRKLWLDALRGISMILVVYGHCAKGLTEFFIYTSPIKMPMFFIISGYLFKPRGGDQKAFYKSIFMKLIVPWLALGMIHYTNPVDRFLNLISGKALWFMPCLIIAEIVWFYIHKIIVGDKMIVAMGILMSIVGMILAHFHLMRYGMFNTALIVQAFFVLGFLLRKNEDLLGCRWKQWVLVAISIFVFLGTYVIIWGNHRPIDVHLNRYPNLLISIMMIISGCLAIFYLFRKVDIHPNWLVYVGQNTLVIYILHGIVLFLLNKYCDYSGLGGTCPLFVFAFLKTVVACLICCIIAGVANRYVPALVGKKRSK